MAPTALIRVPARPPGTTSSSASSAFYRQHHQVEAPAINEHEFRPGWRVKTKLMLLFECKRIDRRQLEAAAALKHWCEAIGRQRTSGWLALRVDGGSKPDGLISLRQIDAPDACTIPG